MVLLLGFNVCTFFFLWWKIHVMERTVRRVIGILVANGWPLNADHDPGTNPSIKQPRGD